jgi:hypothetical protein
MIQNENDRARIENAIGKRDADRELYAAKHPGKRVKRFQSATPTWGYATPKRSTK